ncbi:uncharacterized protein L969DRAFT_84409 [Mixia osmundae IAM 14324]|uniref:UDP-galactose transporter homolog 1 n=1 Tax=Mixia osmundae (strain CBS 9802 / IAM 14324 / JCM 22182 / KY 12970) TaxID=764103 RepID=G7E2Y7_MIXOS|nr:uncharacterized protein L969DRAFT_84409 [Mixia osmundae IAM 14324]KEI42544.1 hypothetical protein L969DRAFT_84409 [Mixia osmundae IAM 14324]GAA97168.1 hypothetical protein E5Q_03844 [Mixia osmundae IAM 14324]
MTVLRLAVSVVGIYVSFLSWALVQERLSTTPYNDPAGGKPRYFRSVIFLNTVQSTLSALSALLYLLWRRNASTRSFSELVGLSTSTPQENGHAQSAKKTDDKRIQHLVLRYLQCSILNSLASPFGFASLRHISYPTMILGKSCKLVPVMLMNIVLYRRKFAVHKYLVVGMVTLGISLFMLCQPVDAHKKSKGAAQSSLFGLCLLLINLLIDGATNSTQDEIFSKYKINGTQMMFCMNVLSTLLTSFILVVPLPAIPVLNPQGGGATEGAAALAFIRSHPGVLTDILLFSLAGAIGQIFIFDTLEHFGSLTLVTITVTRKLFTMLLSVFVFKHKLAFGQWVGVGVVFAGIAVEAQVKRNASRAKKIVQEQEKAKLKEI